MANEEAVKDAIWKEDKLERKEEKIAKQEVRELNECEQLVNELKQLFSKEADLLRQTYAKTKINDAKETFKEIKELNEEETAVLERLRKDAGRIFKLARKAEHLFKKEYLDSELLAHSEIFKNVSAFKDFQKRTQDARATESKIEKTAVLMMNAIEYLLEWQKKKIYSGYYLERHSHSRSTESFGPDIEEFKHNLRNSFLRFREQIKMLNSLIGYLVGEEQLQKHVIETESILGKEIRELAEKEEAERHEDLQRGWN